MDDNGSKIYAFVYKDGGSYFPDAVAAVCPELAGTGIALSRKRR